jgi:SPP1 gp7 family putative phage head morphogenesis protein
VSGAFDQVQQLPGGILPPVARPPKTPPPPRPPSGSFLYPEPDDEPLVRLPAIDRAVWQLIARQVLTPEEFYELSASAKQQAFTISGDLTRDSIERVRELLAEDLRKGTSREQFAKAVRAELPGLPISPMHLEMVYRNNVNEAFAQGAEATLEHPMVADFLPYRAYFPVRDTRAREEHRALEFLGLNGTNVYHKNDPTWRRFRPPWDWGCRCAWVAIAVADAAAFGVEEAKQWIATGIEPPHPPVSPPPFAPSPSWDRLH